MDAQPDRILIVDDISENRALLARRLQRRGYETLEAEGGREALAMLATEPVDLVLLDVMMPEVTGLDVLQSLRQSVSPRELPVIMVTAMAQSQDVVNALSLGANDYVTKPVDFAVALARIQTQLALKKAEEALRDMNGHLEERVAERTTELAEANRQLEQEIKERLRSEERIRQMAFHDALTGLPNRRLFSERLQQHLARLREDGSILGIFCIDLDNFKFINDSLGHAAGDAFLREVSERMCEVVDPERDTVARLGGDEFGVLVTSQSAPAGLESIANRLLNVLQRPFESSGEIVFSGASIGISLSPMHGHDPAALLKAADLALYRAKAEGRGRVRFFEPEMETEQSFRRMIQRDLGAALHQEQFEVHYQPIVDLPSRQMIGVEALVRWNHPERGLVSPAQFVPIAEEAGLMVQIDEWVMRTACLEVKRWPVPVNLAVNLSTLNFRRTGLARIIADALQNSGLDPHRLEVEITESLLLTNTAEVLSVIEQIRDLGVTISLDDFGTGYSALSYLLNMIFDKIKIDRSFVEHIESSEKSSSIVRAVLGLARDMKITSLAEGIENEAQAALLSEIGCSQAQGYFFGRPQRGEAISEALARASGGYSRAATQAA